MSKSQRKSLWRSAAALAAAVAAQLRLVMILIGFATPTAWHATTRRVLGRFGLESTAHKLAIGKLSGGQKARVAFASIFLQRPDVLVVNQPTWGVDAAAAADIRQSLLDLAAAGAVRAEVTDPGSGSSS